MARVELRNNGGQVGHLPNVCMCCGERADTPVQKKLVWYPLWARIVAPILGGGILLMFTQRVAQLHAPLCTLHKRHWFNRILMGIGFVLFLVVVFPLLMALAAAAANGHAASGGLMAAIGVTWFVAFFGGLITLMVWLNRTTIRPKLIDQDKVVLVNVCDRFAAAVQGQSSSRWDEVDQGPFRPRRDERLQGTRDTVRPAAAGMIRCVCPECQEDVKFSDRVRGCMVPCPKCRLTMEVPA